MIAPLDRPTRLVAAAVMLTVSGVGHGLHGWFGIEHAGHGACDCNHVCEARPAPSMTPYASDREARATLPTADDCPLCQMLRGFRSPAPERNPRVAMAAATHDSPRSTKRVFSRDAHRRPPARGPPHAARA